MLRPSLDAIRAMLAAARPDVTRIYINSVPADFVRPSFYAGLQTGSMARASKQTWNEGITWLVVYFAPADDAGDTDAVNQIDTIDAILDGLKAGQLVAPGGSIYDVKNVAVGPYEGDVQITIQLALLQWEVRA